MNFLLPNPDRPAASRGKKVLWTGAGVLLAALLAWPFMQGTINELRARKFRAEAGALLRQGKVEEAGRTVQQALLLDSTDITALRLNAAILVARGELAAGILALRAVLRHPGATAEDHQRLASLAVGLGNLEMVQQEMEWLEKHAPEAPETLRISAEYSFRRGDHAKSERWLRSLLQTNPDHADGQALLAEILVHSALPPRVAEGREILARLARLPTRQGIESLRKLARFDDLSMIEARMVQEMLERHPLRRPEDELTLASLQMQVTPYKRAEIIREAAEGEGLGSARLAWLNRQQAFEKVLELTARGDGGLVLESLLARLDALAGLGRWKEVEGLLGQSGTVLPDLYQKMYFARASTAQGQDRLAELYWNQALTAARSDVTKLALLADYAERTDNVAISAKAWREIVNGPNRTRLAEEKLLRLYKQLRSTEGLQKLLGEMAMRYPGDVQVENDYLYIQFLSGKTSELESAKKLFEKEGKNFAVRCTFALGLAMSEKPAEAAALFKDVTVPWGLASEGLKAVYISILAGGGYIDHARQLEKEVKKNALLPEEGLLLERAVAGRKPSAFYLTGKANSRASWTENPRTGWVRETIGMCDWT